MKIILTDELKNAFVAFIQAKIVRDYADNRMKEAQNKLGRLLSEQGVPLPQNWN